jgi:multidrug resistance protein, MATE family
MRPSSTAWRREVLRGALGVRDRRARGRLAAASARGARSRHPLAAIYRLGIPLGLQLLAEVSVFALLALLAGRLGAHVVSAHPIALGLASFTFMAAVGVGGATAVRVGHAVGAGTSPRRVDAS